MCLVRCENGARAGPFGGVVPVQLASGNAASGNGTAAAGAGAANARRALARRVRDSHARFDRMRARAVALAEDLGDKDLLAEIMEDCDDLA